MMWGLLGWLLGGAALAAEPGSEVVVILDNSCSMAAESGFNQVMVPANDPERLAVLGAQVVADLGSQGRDRVTVLGFGETASAPPVSASQGEALRGWRYTNGTFFRSPLTRAEEILSASAREDKLLIFLSDGVPSPEDNISTTADVRAIFDPDTHADVGVLPIGMYNHPDVRQVGEALLGAVAHSPADLVSVRQAGEVVDAFTNGFARAIGSRPETGALTGGARHTIRVGRYVSEVLAVVVSDKPGPPFSASLESPAGAQAPIGQGNNGCSSDVARHVPAAICAEPRRHYQVFRATSDPEHQTQWTLALRAGDPEVKFGVILRYDLTVGLDVPPTVAAGTAVPVRARLICRGETFNDTEFFGADNFEATATIGGQTVVLTPQGDGIFTGTWTPPDEQATSHQAIAEVVFKNTWMRKAAARPVTITPPPYTVAIAGPLSLAPVPSRWKPATLCGTLDLSPSKRIEDVELGCTLDGPGAARLSFTCTRSGPQTMTVCAETRRWCCGPEGELTATVAGPGGQPPRTAASTPVRYAVENPGLLRCYWLPIAVTLGALFTGWFLYGWLRPYSFAPEATITLAGSEKGLRRATPQILRECPGGKRGFYRNARVYISGAGDMVRGQKQAMIVLEARAGQASTFRLAPGLERRDRRSHKWEPLTPEELAEGYVPNELYRLGDLYLKFE